MPDRTRIRRGPDASDGRGEGGDHVGGAGLPDRPADDRPVGVEDEHGRRPDDAEGPDQLQVLFGVDLDVAHARNHARHSGEHPTRGATGLTEGGGELDQGRPFPQGRAELRRTEVPGVAPRGHAVHVPHSHASRCEAGGTRPVR
jgi:hypothetical protein